MRKSGPENKIAGIKPLEEGSSSGSESEISSSHSDLEDNSETLDSDDESGSSSSESDEEESSISSIEFFTERYPEPVSILLEMGVIEVSGKSVCWLISLRAVI